MKNAKLVKKLGLVVIGIFAIIAVIIIVKYFVAKKPYYFAGTLETTKVVLSARVASDISDVFVIEGDSVYAGQPLMELSCDAYKIIARQINSDYERATQLLARGHLSQAEYDIITRNKQDNDLRLKWCVIIAPINGVVITRFHEAGEVVGPGSVLISVADPRDIWAYFYVPYEMLAGLKIGQKVVGILPEANNMKFYGRIIKISEVAEFTPKNVQTRDERMRLVYGVKVQFDNQDLVLKSGMTIESTLLPENEQD